MKAQLLLAAAILFCSNIFALAQEQKSPMDEREERNKEIKKEVEQQKARFYLAEDIVARNRFLARQDARITRLERQAVTKPYVSRLSPPTPAKSAGTPARVSGSKSAPTKK